MNVCLKDEEPRFCEVLGEWLVCVRPRLKPTTYAAYDTIVARHLMPELRNYFPAEVTDAAIGRFWEKKSNENLSPSTLRGISCVLRAVVKYAGRYGCDTTAEICKITTSRGRRDVSVLSDDERRAIVSTIGKDPHGRSLGVLICLYTGLRVGEICSLRWGDVSPDNRCLTVRRTVSRIRSSEPGQARTTLYIGEPKSSDSRRRIPLPSVIADALGNARENDDCYVLSGKPDKIIEPRSMQRFFCGLLKEAGVGNMNYHALRHSFATQCVELGFDIKALSMILGHADVGITLNMYVHPSFERMRAMMDMLE